MGYCEACFEKQRRLDELSEENQRLKAQLKYRERSEQDGPFGLSTPSSKVPFKENSSPEKARKKGGAVPGHTGHGRTSLTEQTADRVIGREAEEYCPDCAVPLVPWKETQRTVIDNAPREPQKILYRLHHKECPRCRRKFTAQAPVLPRSLYGNHLTAQVAVMHYVHGIPMGRIAEMTGINLGSLVDIFHRLGRYFAPVMQTLKDRPPDLTE